MKFEDTIAHGNRGHHGFKDDSKIVCADGFSASVIAGGGTYCTPRPWLCTCGLGLGDMDSTIPVWQGYVAHDYPGPYTAVEIGFPSERPEPWEEWEQYCEDADDPTDTVYSYVPVELVRMLIRSHGGEVV